MTTDTAADLQRDPEGRLRHLLTLDGLTREQAVAREHRGARVAAGGCGKAKTATTRPSASAADASPRLWRSSFAMAARI